MLNDPQTETFLRHPYRDAILPQPLLDNDWTSIWTNAKKMVFCFKQQDRKKDRYIKPSCFGNIHQFHSVILNHSPLTFFWFCPVVQPLWDEVAALLGALLHKPMSKDIHTLLMGKPMQKTHKHSTSSSQPNLYSYTFSDSS